MKFLTKIVDELKLMHILITNFRRERESQDYRFCLFVCLSIRYLQFTGPTIQICMPTKKVKTLSVEEFFHFHGSNPIASLSIPRWQSELSHCLRKRTAVTKAQKHLNIEVRKREAKLDKD